MIVCPVRPYTAASDEILMTEPAPRLRISGTAALQQFQIPLTLTAIVQQQ